MKSLFVFAVFALIGCSTAMKVNCKAGLGFECCDQISRCGDLFKRFVPTETKAHVWCSKATKRDNCCGTCHDLSPQSFIPAITWIPRDGAMMEESRDRAMNERQEKKAWGTDKRGKLMELLARYLLDDQK